MSILLWSDECDGPLGGINSSKWTMRTGGNWGNGRESQQYTTRQANVRYNGLGQMEITARRETYTGTDGVTRPYTSSRIDTNGKYHFTGGYVEFRARIPFTAGLWPQLWTYAEPWPTGGELDLHESVNGDQVSHQTIHAAWGSSGWGGAGARLLDFSQYHTYGCYFNANGIQFYIDGQKTFFQAKRDPWPFGTSRQFIVMNLSVGNIGGDPSRGAWPQTMLIDYVRVYDSIPVVTPPPPPAPVDDIEGDLNSIKDYAKSRADYYESQQKEPGLILPFRNIQSEATKALGEL